jgi:LacI family transcriptional regulator
LGFRKRVALLIETSSIYGRGILEGIAEFQRTGIQWSVFLDERELRSAPPEWLLEREWDGIISRFTTPQLAKAFVAKKIPTVDLNDFYSETSLPRIHSDMVEIGRMAARHLFERGFRNFAYCGFEEIWSEQRKKGYTEQVGEYGLSVPTYDSVWHGKGMTKWDVDQTRIAKWIRKLPKPVGIMACNDVRGQHVLNACQMLNEFVPERVGVVGVDNDELLCNLCNPPLSSIQPNPPRIGYEAAKLLSELMNGTKQTEVQVLIAPVDVVTRQSTDALGIDDDEVVAAVAIVRERAFMGLSVDELVSELAISRSSLERKFRKYLGHSPQIEIRKTQVKRIKELLSETEMNLSAIAHATGFEHTEYMTVVFKRLVGEAPSEYRKRIKGF